jgi:hypothetical protein
LLRDDWTPSDGDILDLDTTVITIQGTLQIDGQPAPEPQGSTTERGTIWFEALGNHSYSHAEISPSGPATYEGRVFGLRNQRIVVEGARGYEPLREMAFFEENLPIVGGPPASFERDISIETTDLSGTLTVGGQPLQSSSSDIGSLYVVPQASLDPRYAPANLLARPVATVAGDGTFTIADLPDGQLYDIVLDGAGDILPTSAVLLAEDWSPRTPADTLDVDLPAVHELRGEVYFDGQRLPATPAGPDGDSYLVLDKLSGVVALPEGGTVLAASRDLDWSFAPLTGTFSLLVYEGAYAPLAQTGDTPAAVEPALAPLQCR